MGRYIKSGIPKQSNLIQRGHLLQKLSGILNHPITIVSAAEGCGKTALATQIVHQTEADVVWHMISQYEQDLRVFFLALLEKLDPIAPNILSLQVILQQPIENIVHEMTTFLGDHIQRDTVIVIDDWHRLTTQRADEWLQLFVDMLPAHCHLLIVSQTVPGLNMIELIATRRLLRVRQDDLFFTYPEIHQLASQITDEAISNQRIDEIWDKLGGWPVGTILALQPATDLLDSFTPTDEINSSVAEVLFQSIANAMLLQELPDIQQFLTWTSTGEYFNEQLCQDVFNITDSDFLIAEVFKRNLFVTQEAGGYRYHQLFRSFLQAHFKLAEPDAYKSAHRRLAGWYQGQNKPDQAINHYLKADSFQEAADLAENIVYGYYTEGRIETIVQLGQKLHPHNVPVPNLNHVLAQVCMVYELDPNKALLYAQQSLDYAHQQQDMYNIHDVMITLAMIHQLKGDLNESLNILHDVLEYDSLPDAIKGNALNQLAMTEYQRGNSQTAITYYTQALDIIQRTSGLFHHAKLYQELELAYRDVGDVQNANDCLEKQIRLWQQLNNPEPLAMSLNNLGYRYYEQGYYDLADQTFQQGLATIANMKSARARYFLLASLGDLQRDQGSFNEARTTYQRALHLIGDREPYARVEVLLNLATLYRWQLKDEAALTCADNALEEAQERQLVHWVIQGKIIRWHIQLKPWTISIIQAEIDQEIEKRQQLQSHPPIELLTLQWRIAVLNSNLVNIQSTLQQLTRRVNREQSIQPFASEILNNPHLNALWNQIKHSYPAIAAALDRRLPVSTTNNRIVSFVPDTHSIHLYTLGAERIRKNNAPIKLTELSSELVREFLYYFIFIGGGTRDAISRIFWADKSAEAQKDNFHQTVARIRSIFSNQIIIYDDLTDTYQLNPEIRLWCDSLQLEAFVQEAKRLSREYHQTFHFWYQATQLTYGEFLPNLDRDWIISKRRYFQQLSIDAWMGLAEYYQNQKDFRSAISAYEKIESFAPHFEAAYRARMECFSALGEIAAITIVYQSLVDRLHRDLQVKPSQQTYQLYQRLISRAS